MKRIVLLCAALGWSTAFAGLEETRASAQAGDVERQFELGELYEFGFGMPHNDVPALTWYIVAADNGHPKAAKRRDLIKQRLTRDQIAEAERESAKIPRRVIRPAAAPPPPPAAPAPNQQAAPATSPAPVDAQAPREAPAPREALDPLPAPSPSAPTAPAAAEPAPAPAPTSEPALISSPPTRSSPAPAPAPKEDLLGPP